MLALGNPLHAFDRSSLAGDRIVVRRATRGEKLRTLDGVERELDERDLVIADAERAIALAGIMGGEETEVRDSTHRGPARGGELRAVRAAADLGAARSCGRRARIAGRRASIRTSPPQAASFATQLLVELAGARWLGDNDVHGELPARPVVRFRPERADELIGLETPADEQRTILSGFGFDVDDELERDGSDVAEPRRHARGRPDRGDRAGPDGRGPVHAAGAARDVRPLTPLQRLRRRVEDVLVGRGLVRDLHAVARAGRGRARRSGAAGPDGRPGGAAADAPARPGRRRGAKRVGRQRADRRSSRSPASTSRAATSCRRSSCTSAGSSRAASPRPRAWSRRSTGRSRRSRASSATPGRSSTRAAPRASTRAGSASCTRASSRERGAPSSSTSKRCSPPSRDPIQYEDVITFPAVKQDLAFAVDEAVAAGDLIAAAREAAGPELRELRVFDVYRGEQVGEGRKSIALAAAFQSPERTLSDEDAAAIRGADRRGARRALRRGAARLSRPIRSARRRVR